jgi:hypothetical protein
VNGRFSTRIDMAQGHHLVGQQPDGPSIATFRGWGTGQGDQMRFGDTIQFPEPASTSVPMFQHALEALFHQPLTKPLGGPRAAIERLGDLGVRSTRPLRPLIQFQQHLGVQSLVRRHPFSPDDPLQLFTFPVT